VSTPIPLELADKRRLLYAKGIDRERSAVVEALIARGRLAEALEILDRTREPVALGKVRGDAVKAGDYFSLNRSCQILKAEPAPAELRDLAANAERASRFYDAVNALVRAGDAEKAEALRAARCPDFQPFRPANK
jgi:hypothetical protein